MTIESSLVIGATGMVGGCIMRQLSARGVRPTGLARSVPDQPGWVAADLTDLEDSAKRVPACRVVFSTASIAPLAGAIPVLAGKGARRIVAFTTTSIMTKLNSPIPAERLGLQGIAQGEQDFIAACGDHGVEWTILRPTLIYSEGVDVNVTRLARFVGRFGFLPIAGPGSGLRQPVHAEDLASGAIAAAESERAAGKTYVLSGADTVTYREMVGRIFDGLGKPRRIVTLPQGAWRVAFSAVSPLFPGANTAMGERMNQDMAFDCSAATRDFGWAPRGFRPTFSRF